MSWKLSYLPEAEKDLKALDGSQRILVLKAIKKGKYGAFCIYLIVLSILLIIFPF